MTPFDFSRLVVAILLIVLPLTALVRSRRNHAGLSWIVIFGLMASCSVMGRVELPSEAWPRGSSLEAAPAEGLDIAAPAIAGRRDH